MSLSRSVETVPATIGYILHELPSLSAKAGLFKERASDVNSQNRLNFSEEFVRYRQRLWSAEYQQQVTFYVGQVEEKLTKLDRTPDIFVGIPTRKELQTSRAVEAVLEGCAGNDSIIPFIVVFHNYSQPPLSGTVDDLCKIVDHPNVLLIDQRVDPNLSMGDIRGFTHDVIVQAIHGHPLLCDTDSVMSSTDADITGFSSPGTMIEVLGHFRQAERQGRQLDLVCINDLTDPEPFKNDATMYSKLKIIERFDILQQKSFPPVSSLIGGFAAGFGTFVKASTYCAIGGYPPLSYGEDIALGLGIKFFRDSTSTSWKLNHMFVKRDNRKVLFVDRSESEGHINTSIDYYSGWLGRREQSKPIIEEVNTVDYSEILSCLLFQFARAIETPYIGVESGCRLFVQLFEDCFPEMSTEFLGSVSETSMAIIHRLDELTDIYPSIRSYVSLARERLEKRL